MSFMCPKEDELLRDFFPNKTRNHGKLKYVMFLNQVKCYIFDFEYNFLSLSFLILRQHHIIYTLSKSYF